MEKGEGKMEDLAEKAQKGEITKKEAKRRKLTPLGWAFMVVIPGIIGSDLAI